ncbi:hypothetical protein TNCV_1791861 [Trichonephila clavipes]|nr:hypothetical protein TNCV_1791861 [Trichonephila clavipes]
MIYARSGQASISYMPLCHFRRGGSSDGAGNPVPKVFRPPLFLKSAIAVWLGKTAPVDFSASILSLCTLPPPAEAGVMWRIRLGSRVVGKLKCRYR